MGLLSPSPNLVKVKIFLPKHHGFAQLSVWRLLVLRHGPSDSLQGVAIVALLDQVPIKQHHLSGGVTMPHP